MLHPDSGSTLRTIPWPARAAAALLLIAFVFQAAWASRRDSVTIDEFVHLPVGIHALYTGDYSLDPINPPFPRMIAALPMLFGGGLTVRYLRSTVSRATFLRLWR